jgi:hypothetical protein
MSQTAKQTLRLTFPKHLAGEPILFRMAAAHRLVPTIRRAHLGDEGGEVLLDLEGGAQAIEQGIAYLQSQGVIVAPADNDVAPGR